MKKKETKKPKGKKAPPKGKGKKGKKEEMPW